jgi:hypothetical protein
MNVTFSSQHRGPKHDFRVFVAIMVVFLVPVSLTLLTIQNPGRFTPPPGDPTPYSYTVSLLIFLVPVVSLFIWFALCGRRNPKDKRAFWKAVLVFTTAGTVLDTLLGNTLFTFPNTGAILAQSLNGQFPLHLYGFNIKEAEWQLDIPIEEYLFYFFGSLFMLLSYMWADRDWISDYHPPTYEDRAAGLHRVLNLNWFGVLWAGLLIAAAIIYKNYVPHRFQGGFPIYMVILISGFFLPTVVIFRTIKDFINWRALSGCIFFLTLISVVWEAVLGVPYQWWAYQGENMMGIFIGPSQLPIEAAFLWLVAAWGIVNIYEFMRIHEHRERTHRETLFGRKASSIEPTSQDPDQA